MKIIYIAGPMSGIPNDNRASFDAAAARFRAAGWVVLNPVEIGDQRFAGQHGITAEQYLAADIIEIMSTGCRSIALLPGWQFSTGARAEVSIAITFRFTFFDAVTGELIARPPMVTITGGYGEPHAPSLDRLLPEIREWQAATFTKRTPNSIAKHLLREALELLNDPTDAEEMADIFLLLAGVSEHHDLAAAVRDKLEENKRRNWGTPDSEGVVEHIKEPAA